MHLSRSALTTSLLLIALLAALPARADTLWLNNGDQLSGRLLFLDFGSLVFQADNLGRVSVKVQRIRTLTTDGRIQLQIQGEESPHTSRLQAGGSGAVVLDDGQVIALADIDTAVRLRDAIDHWSWGGNLDISLNLKQESHKREYEANTRLDTRVFNHQWRHNLKAELQKKTENSERKDNNYEVTYDLDRFLDEHWFLRLHGRRKRDYLGYDSTEDEFGAGPGYQFWDDEQGHFNLSTQFARTEYTYHFDLSSLGLGRIPVEFKFNNLNVNWDYRQQLGAHNLELFTKGYIYRPHDIPIAYVSSSESGVRYHVTDLVHLSLRFEYDYAEIDPDSLCNRRYFLGLGVNW